MVKEGLSPVHSVNEGPSPVYDVYGDICMECVIRELADRDLDQVVRIEEENFSTPWTRADYANCIIKKEYLALVATGADDQQILGYMAVMISLDAADVCNVSVDKNYEGRGIGSRLLEAMLRALKEKGVTSVFLEVRETNAGAIHLYEKFGFQQISIRKNYYQKPVENALIMKYLMATEA